MAAVDVAFPIDAGVELTTIDRRALEIHGCLELKGIIPETRHSHDQRLGEISLGEITPMNRRSLESGEADCLGAKLDVRRAILSRLRMADNRSQQRDRDQTSKAMAGRRMSSHIDLINIISGIAACSLEQIPRH